MLSMTFAQAFSIDMKETQKHIDSYNRNIDRAPEILKSILGDEKINLQIARNNASTFRVGLDMVSGRINGTVPGGWDDPTIIIDTSEESINNIRSSRDPIVTFEDEREAGRINFEATDLVARAKLAAVLSSTDVLQFGYIVFFH